MTTLLILDGPVGSGKSHHTRRLAFALRERGVDAVPFHHARPCAPRAGGAAWLTSAVSMALANLTAHKFTFVVQLNAVCGWWRDGRRRHAHLGARTCLRT